MAHNPHSAHIKELKRLTQALEKDILSHAKHDIKGIIKGVSAASLFSLVSMGFYMLAKKKSAVISPPPSPPLPRKSKSLMDFVLSLRPPSTLLQRLILKTPFVGKGVFALFFALPKIIETIQRLIKLVAFIKKHLPKKK